MADATISHPDPGSPEPSATADSAPEDRSGLDAFDAQALRRMLDAGWDMQAMYDADGTYVAVSAASARLFGWEPGELVGTSSYDYFHPDDLEAIRAAHDQVLDDDAPATVSYRLRCKDGTYRWVEVVGVGIHPDPGGAATLIHCTTRDITERRRLEDEHDRMTAELRDREERARLIQEYSGVGMALVDLDGSWLDVNPAMCRLLGRSREELLQTTFQAITHPDDLEADLGEMQALLDGTSDGYGMDKRYLRPDGSVVHTRLQGAVVRDTDGHPSYFVAQVLDLSDRVRAEEAERSIEVAHRYQMVGRLAAKIAHQFNNVLAEMSMNIELLDAELARGRDRTATVDESIHRLLRSIRTATGVTRGLQVLGGSEPVADHQLDLRGIASDAADHLDHVLGPDVTIDLRVPDEPCRVHGDAEHITTAVLALLVNASEALTDGGRIRLEVRRGGDVGAAPIGVPPSPSGWVTLTVTDAGVGMPAELLDRVVEPYFSTRPGQLGTGLTVARRVAGSCGGVLDVRSAPGRGTTVSMWFPERVGHGDEPSDGGARQLSVIAVDDRADLSALVARALRRDGAVVHATTDPLEALRWVESGVVSVDVIVTDIVMPAMNGVELVHRLRAVRPHLGVVFISGYSGLGEEVAGVSGARFLAKPFPVKELVAAVRSVGPALRT